MPCKRKKIDPAIGRSKEIDLELKHDAEKWGKYIKLLLLGTGESGKTTIIKQMKILHINGFSETEKKEKIPYIKQNLHESIYTILYNMDKINPEVQLENDSSIDSANFILKFGLQVPEEFTNEYYDHVENLWKDLGVKKAFDRSNEYQLIDSAEHFLNRIEDLRKENYIPTVSDILFCRIITTSISKIEFKVSVPKKYGGGEAKFWMYDVGGQRGHRKKWISVFEGIECILFLIAASDFDLKLREDETQNRLSESFKLFYEMFGSRYLRNSGMIVFLNKQDILKKKIENGKKISDHFPDYLNFKENRKKGDSNEFETAQLFMKQKILDARDEYKHENKDRDIFIHFTTATDSNNIKLVFENVHELILTKILKENRLY